MPKTVSTSRASLPEVGDLISQTWMNLTRNTGTMLMIWVIGILAYLLVAFLIVAAVVITGVVAHNSGNNWQNLFQSGGFGPQMLVPALGGVGLLLAVIIVLFALIGAILQAAVIYVAAQSKAKLSVGDAITMGKSRALRLLGVSILSGFLTFGGLFLFVIPGIVFAVLFSMVTYEVVLGNNGVLKAISVSAGVVKKYFWDVLGRILLLIGIMILAMIVLGLVHTVLVYSVGSDTALLISGLLRFVLNIGMSLFAIVYMATLYSQLKATGSAKPMSLLWVLILSVIGWVMAAFMISSIATVVGRASQTWPAMMDDMQQTGQDNGTDQQNLDNMMRDLKMTPMPTPMMSPLPRKTLLKPTTTSLQY